MGKPIQIGVKVDSDLKERVDLILKDKLNISATDAISGLYEYINHYEKLPFIIERKVISKSEIREHLLNYLKRAQFGASQLNQHILLNSLSEINAQQLTNAIRDYLKLFYDISDSSSRLYNDSNDQRFLLWLEINHGFSKVLKLMEGLIYTPSGLPIVDDHIKLELKSLTQFIDSGLFQIELAHPII